MYGCCIHVHHVLCDGFCVYYVCFHLLVQRMKMMILLLTSRGVPFDEEKAMAHTPSRKLATCMYLHDIMHLNP